MSSIISSSGGDTLVWRPDVATWDFDQDTLTEDAAWHDMDWSSIVPVTKAILVHITAWANAGDLNMYFRKKGYVETPTVARVVTQGVGLKIYANLWLYPDANMIVEYNIAVAVWTSIIVQARAWLI